MAVKKIIKNPTLNLALFAVAFIFTERSLREMFLFSFSYRMMTVHTILTTAFSWAAIALFLYKVFLSKHRKIGNGILPIYGYILIFVFYFVSTLVNSGNISRWADDFIYSLAAILLLSLPEDRKAEISICSWVYLIAAALNILCELITPVKNYMGLWREDFFIGFENAVGWSLLIGMLFSLLDYKKSGNKIKFAIYILLFFANQLMCFCATAVVGALIILIYLVFPFIRNAFEKWNFLVFLGIVAVLFVLLVFFYGALSELPFVKFVVEDVLGKDITMSGRLYVWNGIVPEALKKPLLGHGFGDSTNYFYESSIWNHGYVHAHNEWLQTVYEGGFLTLAAGIIMTALCASKVKSREVKMILFTLLIMLQSDMIAYYPWYLVTLVCEVGLIEADK